MQKKGCGYSLTCENSETNNPSKHCNLVKLVVLMELVTLAISLLVTLMMMNIYGIVMLSGWESLPLATKVGSVCISCVFVFALNLYLNLYLQDKYRK